MDPDNQIDPEVRRRLAMRHLAQQEPPVRPPESAGPSHTTVLLVAAGFGIAGIVVGLLMAGKPSPTDREGEAARPAVSDAPPAAEPPNETEVPEIGARRVDKVVSGEIVMLEGYGLVQLLGVDTRRGPSEERPDPEIGRAALARLTAGTVVKAELDPATASSGYRGQLGLPLVYLIAPDGTVVNVQLVAEGGAIADVSRSYRRREEVVAAQARAEKAQLGVWDPHASQNAPAGAPSGSGATPAAPTDRVLATADGRYHRPSCTLARNGVETTESEARSRRLARCPRCYVSPKIRA